MSITVEEAVERMLAHAPVIMEAEDMALVEAFGQTLAQDIHAPIDQPPFDRSPLDGYALIAADTAQASPEHPAVLQVVDKLYAGDSARNSILPEHAVRMMTGAMIPAGADCVIRQEDTDLGEQQVKIFRSMRQNSNICRCGEEYTVGTKLLPAGLTLDAAAIAVAASVGLSTLPVRRQIRTAILSTGSELQTHGQPLSPGQIYDSNAAYLSVRLRQMNSAVVLSKTVPDEPSVLEAALTEAAGKADIVLTSGGVSVGEKDLLERVLLHMNADVIFHGIAMKPGMPTLFAVKGSTLFVCLSGNPFSAAVPFELLIPPLLAHMSGRAFQPAKRRAKARNGFSKPSPSRRFLRAFYQDGTVSIPDKQANGQMRSMIRCNCLVDIPAGTPEILPGQTLDIIALYPYGNGFT